MTAAPAASAPAGGSRLARRKARTRAAILDAASTLFHQRGFDETSIQQIAEHADTGVGTVYGYFASKEEILREVLLMHSDAASARYRALINDGTSALERILHAFDLLAAYVEEHRRVLLATFAVSAHGGWVDELPSSRVVHAFIFLIRLGIEQGELRPLPPETTARMLVATHTVAVLGIGPWHGLGNDPQTREDLKTLTRTLLVP